MLESFSQFVSWLEMKISFKAKLLEGKKDEIKQCECICTSKNVYLLEHLTGFGEWI